MPMPNYAVTAVDAPNAPAWELFGTITPVDDWLPTALREIEIGAGGTLVVCDKNGKQVTWTVIAGDRLPGWFTQIRATGTTATVVKAWG